MKHANCQLFSKTNVTHNNRIHNFTTNNISMLQPELVTTGKYEDLEQQPAVANTCMLDNTIK